jgi:hypothetical protein
VPVATFDVSDWIWNGFDLSGINKTGSSMNRFFIMSNAFWQLVVIQVSCPFLPDHLEVKLI